MTTFNIPAFLVSLDKPSPADWNQPKMNQLHFLDIQVTRLIFTLKQGEKQELDDFV